MDYNSINFKNGVIDRLQRREDRLTVRGNKAIDKGNQDKADKLFKKAKELEDRQEMKEYSNAIKKAVKK